VVLCWEMDEMSSGSCQMTSVSDIEISDSPITVSVEVA
jgi:hypothetical protein